MTPRSGSEKWQAIRAGLSWSGVSWRWDSARLLARLGRRCDSRWGDDEYTRFAVLHHRYAAAGTLDRMAKRSPMLAAVAGAVEIAHGPESERLAVEARLVALDDVTAIATKTGKPVAVIEAFEKLFCDFRARHDGDSWMCDRVFRTHMLVHQPQTLRSAVLRLAYRGGPVIADQVLSTVAKFVRNHAWDKISRTASDDATPLERLTLMALATLMAPKTAEAQRKLEKQYRKVRREAGLFERDVGGETVAPDIQPQPLWESLREQLAAAYASPTQPERSAGVA